LCPWSRSRKPGYATKCAALNLNVSLETFISKVVAIGGEGGVVVSGDGADLDVGTFNVPATISFRIVDIYEYNVVGVLSLLLS